MNTGTLYLIPSSLGGTVNADSLFPEYNLQVIRELNEFIVENVRTARRFISALGHPLPIDQLTFRELGKHTPEEVFASIIAPLLEGKHMGLLSEAGTPCIADPGSAIVRIAHEKGIRIIPLIGPNSILLALMGSGFNGQHFTFHGYLPVEKPDLIHRIRKIESNAERWDQTQIFIETPYRNRKLFEYLVKTCKGQTLLCIAIDLTLPTQSIRTMTISEWSKASPDLHKKPAVFLLYR
jgi:16S rRNA (cytidine1402-2'-O)-methyltransferase